MKQIIILMLVCFNFLMARENPFAPAKNLKLNDTAATNVYEERKDFSKKSTKLPSEARILKYIEFAYQALDGSIQRKKVAIDERIDWHDPLILIRESEFLENEMQKNELIPTPPVTLTIDTKEVKKSVKTVVKFKDLLAFEVNKREIFIRTNDENIRQFMVVKPYKIVLDFEKDTAFYTQKLELNQPPFMQVEMGNHDKYYRAAIWLDGPYKYKIKVVEDGVLITLM